jgi:hypothetical protein
MRRTVALLLAISMLGPGASAADKNDWTNVKRLHPGSFVIVLLDDKATLRGRVESVTDAAIEIDTADHLSPQLDWSQTIDHAKIEKIVLRRQPHPPDPSKLMAAGAGVGAAGGLILGIVRDERRGENYNWFLDGLVGAGLGFIGAVALSIPIDTISIARSARGKVIYEKKGSTAANPLAP